MELELCSVLSPTGWHGALLLSPNEVSPNFRMRYLRKC